MRINYVQCTLRREDGSAVTITRSWIPRKMAKLGKSLRLRDESDVWSYGWVVQQVGNTVLNQSKLPDYRKAIRRHRQTTGDSLR